MSDDDDVEICGECGQSLPPSLQLWGPLEESEKVNTPLSSVTDLDFMKFAVRRMAEDGPQIVSQLREAVGGDYNPGQALDGLLQVAATMEMATFVGNPEGYAKAAVAVLFLARDIALQKGVIKPLAPMPEA